MYKLLNAMGYYIPDTGCRFRICSVLDILCLIVYIFISAYCLCVSKPTNYLWVLNLSIMGRIIIRNKIEVNELNHQLSKPVEQVRKDLMRKFINWHRDKMIIELTATVFSSVVFLIGVSCNYTYGVIDYTFKWIFLVGGGAVLLVNFCEDLLRIIEKMYSATSPL